MTFENFNKNLCSLPPCSRIMHRYQSTNRGGSSMANGDKDVGAAGLGHDAVRKAWAQPGTARWRMVRRRRTVRRAAWEKERERARMRGGGELR
jgi:hypothetical protein